MFNTQPNFPLCWPSETSVIAINLIFRIVLLSSVALFIPCIVKVSQWTRPRTSTKHASFLQKAILQHSSAQMYKVHLQPSSRAAPMLSVKRFWALSLQLCTVRAWSHIWLLSYSTPQSWMLSLLGRIYLYSREIFEFVFKHSLFIIASLQICSFPSYCPRISEWVLLSIKYLKKLHSKLM